MIRSNFHTHSSYCDGHDAPEEMVQAAIDLGFTHLGFSGHAHNAIEDCSMSAQGQEEYRQVIRQLQKKYEDKIELLCGLEKDYYADPDRSGFDYVIGSVHFCKAGRPASFC